jgi:hypothetical protein
MKSVGTLVSVCLVLCAFAVHASAAGCPAYIPAGVTFRVLPDENLTAGLSAGPTVLTVNSDVRFFPNRPPILARGSKVLATIVESKQAGRLHGKARLRLTLSSILTSDFCEYPISAKVIEASRRKVEDDVVWGRGHGRRDLVALLFPPTTVYQLVRLPSRGPKLVIDNETPMTIKIMETVSLGENVTRLSENDPLRLQPSVQTVAPVREPTLEPARGPLISRTPADTCWTGAVAPASTLVRDGKVVRPVRNLTPYHVSLLLDDSPVMMLPPCYGPSMISMPSGGFRLAAAASVPGEGGQRQMALKVVPNPTAQGWDVVVDDSPRVALGAN